MKSSLLLFAIWAIIPLFSKLTSGAAAEKPSGTLENTPAQLRDIYLAELGVREASNHNDGSRVEEYLHYVGLKKGSPWCAAYVCFCLGKAGIPNPHSGYCPNLFPAGKVIWRRGNSHPPTQSPSPGDVFGIWFPDKGRIAHVGFIDEWGEKYAVTVEGNTNEAGSRDGDGVYRKRRLISSLYKVSRYR